MDRPTATHYRWDDLERESLNPQIGRRMVTGERIMLAHVYFEKGGVVPLHSHDNEQLTYILEGTLRFWLGEDGAEVVNVSAGEVLHIPSNLPHRAEALDAELYRRRAAGESLRALAPDYGVAHTTLSRHFARPQAAEQVKEAGRLLRAERRAVVARAQAGQKAERSRADQEAARVVEAGGGMQAVIEATGLRTLENTLSSICPAILAQAFENDDARAAAPRLRRLQPDRALYRRRAAGESLRALAPDYGVAHTTLSRHFARPQTASELNHAGRILRAERRAARARLQAEQKAEREARRLAKQQAAATPLSEQPPQLGRIIRPPGGFNW